MDAARRRVYHDVEVDGCGCGCLLVTVVVVAALCALLLDQALRWVA
jgi:hypothetical protein